jgi:hypothetical protein
MPRFLNHIAVALSAMLISSLEPAAAQPISSTNAQTLLNMCQVNILEYEAELKILNNDISLVENRYRILGAGGFYGLNPDASQETRDRAHEGHMRAGKKLDELYKRRDDLLLYRKFAKKSCDTYEEWVREAKARERSGPAGGGPVGGAPGAGDSPVVREHEEETRKVKKDIADAKSKLDGIEKELDELEKNKTSTPAPPEKAAGGTWDFGVFGGGVFGGNSPELKPFDQNLDQDGGYQIGTDMIWRDGFESGNTLGWSIGLEGSYTERDAVQITNQFAPGVLPVRGHDATIAGLIVGGLEIPLGPVRLRADAGAGIGLRDVEITGVGGAPIASGDGTVLAWRAGGGVIVPLGQETFLQLMYIHQNFGAVDAATSGGAPFEFDYQTSRAYRVSVGFRY